MCKHSCTLWDLLIERGFKNTSIFSKHSVKTSRIFCHSILLCFKSKDFKFFFLLSLLKCILQQYPCHAPTWLSDISPLATPKLSMATLIIFTVPSLWLPTGGNFSTSLLYTHWRRPEIIIFVKVSEINGRRGYLLALCLSHRAGKPDCK